MASGANVFRKTTVEALTDQTQASTKLAGMVIKSYRDYSAPGNPSMSQQEVATAAGTHQSVVSDLERGKKIPDNPTLQAVMQIIGLNLTDPEPRALFNLLTTLRDNSAPLKALAKHKP